MISMKSVIHSVTDVTKASNNLRFCLMYWKSLKKQSFFECVFLGDRSTELQCHPPCGALGW